MTRLTQKYDLVTRKQRDDFVDAVLYMFAEMHREKVEALVKYRQILATHFEVPDLIVLSELTRITRGEGVFDSHPQLGEAIEKTANEFIAERNSQSEDQQDE